MINKANVVITIAIALVTVSIWAFFNRPEKEPLWPEKIMGFCYSPYQADQNPAEKRYPTEEQLESDLALMSGRTHAIRTYSMEGPLARIPRLARKYHINVALGAWIGNDPARNKAEIDQLIRGATDNSNVVRVIVGNEAILRNDIPLPQLINYLIRVRKALPAPVSTAEPWHIWLKYPELAENVDFLAVHLLPYWEGIPLDHAVDFCIEQIKKLETAFPDKPIVITEVGWPSEGRTRQGAVASAANEGAFLRRFLERATHENYVYYVMEAFDQPWKRRNEGSVGAYWGVYDVYRNPKFAFSKPIIKIPEWRVLAGISVLIAIITLIMLVINSETLNIRGRGFLALIAFSLATASVWSTYDYVHQYLTPSTIIIGILIVFGIIGIMLVLLTEAHEWAEILWVKERRRKFVPVRVEDDQLPMVSIHLPIHNEPPQMVRQTLDGLARLDYPRFEVIVMDNNTCDPDTWMPVQEYCRHLGPHFRFFHEEHLPGFKAGALNYALHRTHPDASVVGVIDSDYVVDPSWLRDLVPQFTVKSVGIVQAPQDYRDDGKTIFKSMCYSEYRGFFFIGMITRNERNAIIQHGTMTLIRRNALNEVGGWGQWCITEDAELGLRIFERGYEAIYIPRSYGKGLMPDTFIDYKKQRFRWAYGAIQIIRRHAGKLTGFTKSRLTAGQRYHFWAGWLPWMADSINLVFNMGALFWSLGMAVAPERFDPPLIICSAFPLALFCFKVSKILFIYQQAHIVVSVRQTFAAATAGLALSHTIGKAVLAGFFTRSMPFFRTPKMARKHALLQAVNASREEFLMMIALWLLAFGIRFSGATPSPDLAIWIVVLLIQSLTYAAAVAVSLVSALPSLDSGNPSITEEPVLTSR